MTLFPGAELPDRELCGRWGARRCCNLRGVRSQPLCTPLQMGGVGGGGVGTSPPPEAHAHFPRPLGCPAPVHFRGPSPGSMNALVPQGHEQRRGQILVGVRHNLRVFHATRALLAGHHSNHPAHPSSVSVEREAMKVGLAVGEMVRRQRLHCLGRNSRCRKQKRRHVVPVKLRKRAPGVAGWDCNWQVGGGGGKAVCYCAIAVWLGFACPPEARRGAGWTLGDPPLPGEGDKSRRNRPPPPHPPLLDTQVRL